MRPLSLLLLVGFLFASFTFAEEKLVPVPEPPLAHLEAAVSKQLREGRAMVDSVTGKATVDKVTRGNAYGEMARLYHAYELYDAAEACYRNATALSPQSYDWNYGLANLMQKVGKFEEALVFYNKLLSIKLKSEQLYLVYIRIGQCLRPLNRKEESKAAYEKAFKLNPNGPAVLARLGEIALQEKKYDQAIHYLKKALEIQPEANRLHYQLAMAYRYSNQMESARKHLGLYGMVGVQPADPLKETLQSLITGYRVHLLAGRLAFSARRYQEAAESFAKAIEANPKEPAARVNLGATLVKLKKFKEAIQQFQEAAKLKPDNETVYYNLGVLHGFLGDQEKAVAYLKKVVQLTPKDANAYLNLAGAYLKRNQKTEALTCYNNVLSHDPANVSAWLGIGNLFKSTGQYREALLMTERAYKRIPHNRSIRLALINLLAAAPDGSIRNGKRALTLAEKLYKENPSFQTAQLTAIALAELNRCPEAVQWMEQAISLAYYTSNPSEIIPGLEQLLHYFKTRTPCRPPVR